MTDENRGVSPVIGVILMVAITVILAAVIGSFVLGIGGDVEKAPQASLTIENGDLVHQGGDSLSNINVTTSDAYDSDIALGPGDSVEIVNESGGSFDSGDTVRVIHNPSDSVIWEGEHEE